MGISGALVCADGLALLRASNPFVTLALRYRIDLTSPGAATDEFLIIRLDRRRVATAVGWNSEPAAGELRLKHRTREGPTSIGTDAFFFEEGTGGPYQKARYGEFRVATNGDTLLVALRDERLLRLDPP